MSKLGLQASERSSSVFYTSEKKKLQADVAPDLNGIKRHTDSMLGTMEGALQNHIAKSQRDGADLSGEMLEDLISMCSQTRAYQIILEDLTKTVNKS